MKDKVKGMRKQVTDWEKIATKDISDKELLSKIYIEPMKLNDKMNYLIENKQRT